MKVICGKPDTWGARHVPPGCSAYPAPGFQVADEPAWPAAQRALAVLPGVMQAQLEASRAPGWRVWCRSPAFNVTSLRRVQLPRASGWESWNLLWLCQQLVIGPKISEVCFCKPLVPTSHWTCRGDAPHPSRFWPRGSGTREVRVRGATSEAPLPAESGWPLLTCGFVDGSREGQSVGSA